MAFFGALLTRSGSRYRRALAAIIAVTGAAVLPSPAPAQSIWGGTGSTTSTSGYNLGTNWSTGNAPGSSGKSARFGATGNSTINVNVSVTPDSWTFNANSKSYSVGGAGAIHFGNAATLTNNANAGQTISISNDMTGATLSQAAASTLTISGTNSFTNTNVSAGTLVNSGTLTSTVVIAATGTLTTTNTIHGDLTNRGTTNASGTVDGAVGNLGAGVFNVSAGNLAGITTLTNGSSAAIGVNVSAGRTLSAATIVNNAGATIANAGTLTTSAGITNQAGGTLTTTGIVNSDLTSRGTTNASGTINGAIVNQGAGVFNVTGALTTNGILNNNNTAQLIVSNGDFGGITILRNNSTAAIGIDIAATRTLSADVVTNASGATINAAGTLIALTSLTSAGTITGAGSIVGATTFTSGGVFAPGNGTAGSSMSVTGSLALQSGAVYMVQISPTGASFASVTGGVTLTGATVSANYAAGAYVNKQYMILTATGGINGTFNSLLNTNLPPGFTTALSYVGNNAYLNLTFQFALPPHGGLNVNQQNVANTIVNAFNSNGTIPIAFGGLTPAGLTQISGETAVGSQQATFQAMNQFMGVMTDPFVAGRGGGTGAGGGATGYTDEALGYAGKRKPNDALAAIYTKTPAPVQIFEQRWSTWAAGYGGSQTTDGNAALGSNNTTSSLYGTAAGADYRISPFTLAGFAIAGGGTNFSVAGAGYGRSDLFQAGAFIRHTVGQSYLSAAVAYGWQDITTDRYVTVAGVDHLHAEFNANAISGRLEGGHRYVAPLDGGIGLTPYAAAQFTTFELPNYAESVLSGAGTFAQNYASKSVTDTRSELGLRADKSFAVSDGVLTLRGRVAWAHDFDPDRSIAATFQTLPGSSFVVNGAGQAGESALTTASAEMKWNGWSAAATFEGEFSNVTRSYAGKGVVRYAW